MIWIEIVCDGCSYNPIGDIYRKGSVTRVKQEAKQNGWKIVKGKIYCPECQSRLRLNK